MTLDELNRHLTLITELKKAKDMLQSLWNAANPGGQVLTGMPHTPGVKDKIGDLAVEIADLESDIADLETLVAESEVEVKKFISEIKDIQTKMVFRLRFCRGYTWKEVAKVLGGGNTEDSVKKVCYRYLGEWMEDHPMEELIEQL